ncbi:MAG: ankyrin repeat domain-containing protein [Rhodocyclaceae bacterium]|nr:MAG: ankyrin repeat domain-containing protein [Rhodocyclaceae bacterium]
MLDHGAGVHALLTPIRQEASPHSGFFEGECAVATGKSWARRTLGLKRVFASALGAALLAAPAVSHAQFSDSYKFLEAVKKADGDTATKYLNEPGTTIVNTRDVTTGQTGLLIAVARRDLLWTQFMLQRGANPNIGDKHGVTPLVVAARLSFVDGVNALIDAGARVNDANDTGETPLISAVHQKDIGIMRALLKAGADADRPDNSGRSARDYARLQGENSATLTEIQARAKPAAPGAPAGSVYGPRF